MQAGDLCVQVGLAAGLGGDHLVAVVAVVAVGAGGQERLVVGDLHARRVDDLVVVAVGEQVGVLVADRQGVQQQPAHRVRDTGRRG